MSGKRISREERKKIAIHYLEIPKGGIKSTADHFGVSQATVSNIVKEMLAEIGHPAEDLYTFAFSRSRTEREELAEEIRELD